MHTAIKTLLLFVLLTIAACKQPAKQPVNVKKTTPSVTAAKHATADTLKLDTGAFPIDDFIYSGKNSDDEKFGNFYLRFMAAAKAKDRNRITAMIHFPFQTTKQKAIYDKRTGDYNIGGAVNWDKGLLGKAEFNNRYHQIFSNMVLNAIPDTRPKDVTGYIPGDAKPGNDYIAGLRRFTDKGSNIYEVNIELPVDEQTPDYGYIFFSFGRINGVYKVLSYYLQ